MHVIGTIRKYMNSGMKMILVLLDRKSLAAFTMFAANMILEH